MKIRSLKAHYYLIVIHLKHLQNSRKNFLLPNLRIRMYITRSQLGIRATCRQSCDLPLTVLCRGVVSRAACRQSCDLPLTVLCRRVVSRGRRPACPVTCH